MRNSCRLCSNKNLFEIINLGNQPIAHRLLLTPHDEEEKYSFIVHFCRTCGLIQICNPIDPSLLYLDYNYCFSSWKSELHMADELETIFSHTQARSVLDIGCNDGKFLDELKKMGVSILLGVEPNPFASQKAMDKGFRIYSEMLNKSLCENILNDHGKVDLIVARQVLEHILDIGEFFRCVDLLLSDDGFLFIDIPDFETGLSMGDCSVLWEEHVNYFTESVIRNILQRFKFQPISTQKYNFSGGTLAFLAKRTTNTDEIIPPDLDSKIHAFNQKVNKYGNLLKETLSKYHKKGFKIVLYGVGCRACTIVNTLDLGKYIDFAIDDQLERQNKYMPGSKLQITSPQTLRDYSNSVLCLLAVNQENESVVKQRLKNISHAKIEFVSLFSPNNIWIELERLNEHLSSYVYK